MTKYPNSYFSATPGILEQLILACTVQKIANRNYLPQALDTGFTEDSISSNVQLDIDEQLTPKATLTISIQLPTNQFDRQSLIDKNGLHSRIASVNPTNIADISLAKKPAYTQKSFNAMLPSYLLDDDDINNTLERRIAALSLQLISAIRWLRDWDYLAKIWITNGTINSSMLAKLEIIRDTMLDELIDGISLRSAIPSDISINSTNSSPVIETGGNSPAENEFNDGSIDPLVFNTSPLSESLLSLLNGDNASFGSASNEISTPQQPEQPTLPDC